MAADIRGSSTGPSPREWPGGGLEWKSTDSAIQTAQDGRGPKWARLTQGLACELVRRATVSLQRLRSERERMRHKILWLADVGGALRVPSQEGLTQNTASAPAGSGAAWGGTDRIEQKLG